MGKGKHTSIIAAILALSVLSAHAVEVGTSEIGLSGSADFDKNVVTGSSTLIDTEATYGYFVAENVEVLGVGAIIFTEDEVVAGQLGARSEYHFSDLTVLRSVPFVGAGVSWLHTDSTIGLQDQDTALFDFSVGIKYMLSDSVALAVRGVYEIATDDVFFDGEDQTFTDDNWGFDWGLRIFF